MRFHRNSEGSFWLDLLGLHFSGQLCRWRGGVGADIRWGDGYTEGIGFGVRCFYGLWFTWKMPWKLMKRIPRWPFDDSREIGFNWNSGNLRLLLAYSPNGSHRRNRLWVLWKNRELTIWRNTWVIGRDRFKRLALDERPVVIDVGRWPSDSYRVTQKIERMTWKNRFRSKSRVAYWWDMEQGQRGIPTSTKGKWGDKYDETYGFGMDAPDTDDVSTLLAEQPLALARRLTTLLREWPAGLVAQYDEVPV